MSVPVAALELEKARVQAARTRFEVGVADAVDVEAAGTRVIELQTAIEVFKRKIEIRQAFLKGDFPAAVASCAGSRRRPTLRRTALARRIEFARRQLTDIKARIEIGTLNPLNLAEAELRLQELQLEMTKADYDLLLIRKQLGK
jgi:outer membrane protein TolC